MERAAASFQESQDLRDNGFPQGTSFFRWYWGEALTPVLAPRHERFQWSPRMKTGDADALCDGYPLDWGLGRTEWCDAPTLEEILDWKPDAAIIATPGVRHATAGGRIEVAAKMVDALARAVAPRK